MELTLEKAKELSEKKWQVIVDNNGVDRNILEFMPELVNMNNKCAMCQFVITQNGLSCPNCIYFFTACDSPYRGWIRNRCKDTAKVVLDSIILSNSK